MTDKTDDLTTEEPTDPTVATPTKGDALARIDDAAFNHSLVKLASRGDLASDVLSGVLSPREAIFVAEYLIDENGSRAARDAGYGVAGAGVQAHRMLKRPNVMAALAREIERQGERLQVDADWIIRRLAHEAQTAPQDGARVRALELLGKRYEVFGPDRLVVTDGDDVFARAAADMLASKGDQDDLEVVH